jgi:hypothetical protein
MHLIYELNYLAVGEQGNPKNAKLIVSIATFAVYPNQSGEFLKACM